MEYNELKKTEAIWIPKIPKHWDLIKVRHLFKESSVKGFPNEPLLVASQEHGVVSKDVFGKRTMEATKDFHNLKLVEKGDFVISLRSFQGGIEYAHQRGIISPAYTILKELKPINKRYFKHLFKSKPFISLMTLCVKGIRDGQNIDFPTFKGEYLPLPPIEEQAAIGAYLDRKTQQIQSFIQKKERLIELLEEEKQSKIDACISNGFNKKGSLINERKDIPPYPSHWHLTRLKYLFKILNGYAFSTSSFIAEGIQVLKISSLYQNRLSLERQPTFVSPSYLKKLPQFVVSKNDILMSLTGTLGKEDYGFAVLLNKEDVYLLNQRVAKLIPNKKLSTKYALYLLRSRVFLDQLYLQPSGTKQANLSNDHILPLYIAIPEVYEQEKNIERLERELSKLENGILNAKSEIEKAKEYQESLITQVVSGQLKVPTLTHEKVMH